MGLCVEFGLVIFSHSIKNMLLRESFSQLQNIISGPKPAKDSGSFFHSLKRTLDLRKGLETLEVFFCEWEC